MRRSISFFVLVLLLVISQGTNAIANDSTLITKTRKLHKDFKATAADKFTIINSFGDLHIDTWDSNRISIDIEISGISASEAKCAEIVKNVFFQDTEFNTSRRSIRFETKVETPYNNNDGVHHGELKVNLVIHIPSDISLIVTNTFGDVYLGDFSGDLRLTVNEGVLQAENIKGKNKIIEVDRTVPRERTDFIRSIESGRLTGSGSYILHIISAGDVKILGWHSVSIDKAHQLDILRGGGGVGYVTIDSVDYLYGEISNTFVDIKYLARETYLDFADCGRIWFRSLGNDAEKMRFNCKNSKIICHLNESANASINFYLAEQSTLTHSPLPNYLKNLQEKRLNGRENKDESGSLVCNIGNSEGKIVFDLYNCEAELK